MKCIVKDSNLYFKYDKEYILEDINFMVNKGDFVGIIGSNGTGKSTLIKLMLGQLKPDKGSISVYGINPVTGKNLDKIGYVPQVGLSRGIDFPATVEEIVMMNLYKEIGMFRRAKKHHYERVKEVLDIVDMKEFLKRKFSDLSGGQQQRVIIAKAIVNNPDILILDEPTTGIDHKSQETLYRLLSRLHKEKKITIVMISHNLDRIKNYSNKLIELDKIQREV